MTRLLAALVLVYAMLPRFALASAAAPDSVTVERADSVHVVLLGTGMPVPDHSAQGPATAAMARSPRHFSPTCTAITRSGFRT